MMTPAERLEIEAKLHAHWQLHLDETTKAAMEEGLDEERIGLIAECLMHVGITEVARKSGAATIARQLWLIALKFREAADLEERATGPAPSSPQKH